MSDLADSIRKHGIRTPLTVAADGRTILKGSRRLNLFIESDLAAAVCPDCQHMSLTVHEVGEPQLIRDLSIWQRESWLRYAPRRFKCSHCVNTFVERVMWREAGLTYTTRYEQFVYERAKHEPLRQVAKAEGLSEDIVQGIFERAEKAIAERGYPAVKVLCLDEIAQHKGQGHYYLIISAPELGLVLEVLKDRK